MIDSWSHGDWSPANPPLTHPFFASGEIEFMAHGAMGIGPLQTLPRPILFSPLAKLNLWLMEPWG
ncbi:MAG: hypothetical protein ABS33_06630, partial [Verrucomicrobia subdivision 6 bacterium BACL9 MAG-120924-bin69]